MAGQRVRHLFQANFRDCAYLPTLMPRTLPRLRTTAIVAAGVLAFVHWPSARLDDRNDIGETAVPGESATPRKGGELTPAAPAQHLHHASTRVETPPLPPVFATYPVIHEERRPGVEFGETEVRRVVRAPFKYPWIRIRSMMRRDPQTQRESPFAEEAVAADQLLVSLQPGVPPETLAAALAAEGIAVRERFPGSDTLLLQLPSHEIDTVDGALSRLASRDDLFVSVDPNGMGFGGAPNDPRFAAQWALQNTGQSGGTAGADVNAAGLWSIVSSAPKVLVAILDSGMDFAHEDLAGVAWSNPQEIPGNGIDDDGNGFVDDGNGWDFVNSDSNPQDDHDHGSHVTGILAARRGNAKGITGLADPVMILPCKILDASNAGFTSDLILALDYARLLGARVMNLSLQNYPFGAAFQGAVNRAESAGIVLCVCAGNQGMSNDTTPNYPSSFTNANIIAIGNHDRTDVRWAGVTPSNFGLASVDLFAPGREVVSTVRGSLYSSFTGTSMACPHVAAVAAIIRALNPAWTVSDVKSCILQTVTTRPAYGGICVTGGRLNAEAAIKRAIKSVPDSDPDSDGAGDLLEYSLAIDPLRANAGGLPAFHMNGAMLELTYTRTRNDISYSVESSDDFISWSAANVNQGGPGTPVTATTPPGNAGHRYLRLKVQAIP